MNKLIEVLVNRRVWAAIVGLGAFILNALHSNYQVDVPGVTDALSTVGNALALLIPGLLALWSYLKPKPKK